jgi:hypothetical protein
MLITNARRARQVAGWAGIACAALLVTACNSPGGSAVAAAPSRSAAPATSAGPSVSPAVTASTGASPSASSSTSVREIAASTFLAQGQDINGTLLFMPACNGQGCALSGDSTAILDKMTWRTWSATEAVGTGTYELNGCNPSCAAGPVYPVPAVVTLTDPVKACSSSGTRWVWTRASFMFPGGLPKALQGGNGPKNPWVFDTVVSAAKQSCAS